MKKWFLLAAIIAAIVLWQRFGGVGHDSVETPADGETAISGDAISAASESHASGRQVSGLGIVTRILADDDDGSRHQRFILRLDSGQTLLVSHNIDLAPRVSDLHEGDTVSFHGVYEWNDQGGIVHWTHGDPEGRHEAGWLRHGGHTYQ